jgi:hypothetical protein
MRSNVRFIPPVSIPGFCVHPARQALFVNRPSGHLSAFRFFVALVNIPIFRHLSTFRFFVDESDLLGYPIVRIF